MSARFAWVAGSRGAWLAERLEGNHGANADPATDEPLAALSATVPAGFDALVRILPPFLRERPETGDWAQWRAIAESPDGSQPPNLVEEPVTWAAAAAALGRELGPVPLAWNVLGASDRWGGSGAGGTDSDAAGWRYSPPRDGALPAELFERVLTVLARHTATPDGGVACVWEGYGGLVSAQGVGWFFAFPEWPRWVPRPLAVVTQRILSRVLSVRARARRFGWRAALWGLVLPGVAQRPGTGTLPREAARGERLELPDRAYVCFAATPHDLADPGWPARAPWIAEDDFTDPQTPNVAWPDGREWVLVSEIDLDTTLIACSRACAEELRGTPGIEAQLITRDTALF